MIDNKSVFSTLEFESWAYRSRLIAAERFLIERYLDKQGITMEAGTGGGRILLSMKGLGFEHLFGFDFVSAFIDQARKRDTGGSICFEVGDAVRLGYQHASFDQIIYLQQILCFLEEEASRLKALKEAHRVLKTGGTALFSFLSYEARARRLAYRPYITYIHGLRKIRGSTLRIQNLPWLKMGGKINLGAIVDRGPYVYWYKAQQICDLLGRVGFRIAGIGSTYQIEQGRMCKTPKQLEKEPIRGMLYVVCNK